VSSCTSTFWCSATCLVLGTLRSRARRVSSWRKATPSARPQDLPPLGLLEHTDVPDKGSGEQWLHPRRDDGQLLESVPGTPGKLPDPRHHGVDHRGRDAVAAAGQHLGDEERVAVGRGEDPGRVDARVSGEAVDRTAAQRLQRQPLHGLGGEGTEEPPQRVRVVDVVVPKGQDDHGSQRAQPSADVAQRVERGVVGPVHVLDDQHGGPSPRSQLEAQGLVDRLLVRARCQCVGQRAGVLLGRVAQRSERPRRQQVVAAADQDPGPVRDGAHEGAHQARLADAGLAQQQRDGATALARVVDRAHQDL
jgi:hypothetical protein